MEVFLAGVVVGFIPAIIVCAVALWKIEEAKIEASNQRHEGRMEVIKSMADRNARDDLKQEINAMVAQQLTEALRKEG